MLVTGEDTDTKFQHPVAIHQ